MAEVTASLVVNFRSEDGAEGKGILRAEFDTRDGAEGGLNPNGTSFLPGDAPVFLVFKSDSVTLDSIQTSEGNTSLVSRPLVTQEEWVTFANVTEARLSYPASGTVDILKTVGMSSPNIINGNILRVPEAAVGVVKVRYPTKPGAYRLSGASGDDPVVIVVTGVSA